MAQDAMTTIPLWFSKRRGIALAIASVGPAIGGFVLPPIMNILNNQLGISWYAS